jgi:hypothetical protein
MWSAMKGMNGKELDGRNITTNEARCCGMPAVAQLGTTCGATVVASAGGAGGATESYFFGLRSRPIFWLQLSEALGRELFF